MPLYDYKCKKCSNQIEMLQPMGSPAPFCPKCGITMEQQVSFPAQVKIDKVPPHLRKKSFGTAAYSGR